jgi:TetR/AcrR family transcriptional repressor of nem operon
MADRSPTAERLVDAAETLVQTRGYNGFSYADLSDAVGIRKASVHHHFPGKGDLGRAVAERYREQFAAALDRIDAEVEEPRDRLDRYAALYAKALSDRGRMCLCGMLAAEYATLPSPVQDQVRAFFHDQRTWLTTTLVAGGRSRPEARRLADAMLAGLEGALLVSRAGGDAMSFTRTSAVLIDALA